jgi:gamma-glutamyltranspeptidase/glutathione hydrolase
VATRAAAASEGHVAQIARDALTIGNAVDAVLAGVLEACAADPSVLLGPLQVLVAGGGAGLFAIDGRLRQPGLGLARPRGAREGDAIPRAALVAVPSLPAAVATVLASFGSVTLRKLAGPAAKTAKALSPERGAVLEAFSWRGAPVVTDESIVDALLAVAGRSVGGVLSAEDLSAARPEVVRILDSAQSPPGWLTAPWSSEPALDATRTHVVAAADARGLVCIACYEVHEDGVAIPELGLVAPASAEPVRRGEPRVRPGQPRPAAAPVAIRSRKGVTDLAVGLAVSPGDALSPVLTKLDEQLLPAEALAGAPGRHVAVVRTRTTAAVVSSA